MTDSNSPSGNTPPPRRGFLGLGKKPQSNTDFCQQFMYDVLAEQRSARRWNLVFKYLLLLYLFAILALMVYQMPEFAVDESGEKHTALVRVEGIISNDSEASADKIIRGLRAAFKDKDTAGVILMINSPGGSPVQSGYVNDEIKRLRKKYKEEDERDIPVYAVISDLCASGGYYIAAAADKIYADKASIVGSIGVLMNSFGFVDAMEKIGVERRLLTAGEHKAMLDPFSPAKAEDTAHLQDLLDNIHEQFIEVVKAGRGDKLKDDPKLFSGLVWTGEQALEYGLVDDLASASSVAREVIEAEDIVDFTRKKDYLDRFAERLGATMADVLANRFNLQHSNLIQ